MRPLTVTTPSLLGGIEGLMIFPGRRHLGLVGGEDPVGRIRLRRVDQRLAV
ncbi:MAG: hypothetical protein R2704_06125 [Microthrixaceae bacterium]